MATASEKLDELLDLEGPATVEQVANVGQAFLEEAGDYPGSFMYLALTAVVDQDVVMERLTAQRSAHFGGKPPPWPTSKDDL